MINRYPKQSKSKFEFWKMDSIPYLIKYWFTKNSIQIIIQFKKKCVNFEISWIQFNKIFIQLENINIMAGPNTNRQKLLVVDLAHKLIIARVQKFSPTDTWQEFLHFAAFVHRGRQFADKKFIVVFRHVGGQ